VKNRDVPLFHLTQFRAVENMIEELPKIGFVIGKYKKNSSR
jgi:hypothetical protein